MNVPAGGNLQEHGGVVPGMKPISEAHVAQPGLAVVDVAACDDQTAFAVQELLAGRWATASADRTTRVPGEPGVRLRCYLDVRQDLGPQL
ncbi:DUF6207 family protein [Streptomyces caelestis]|uniref:DUF6207 family protein n=1 Tax=Streptomyces caelestis TaxID=36816 RepID=UPI003667B8F5